MAVMIGVDRYDTGYTAAAVDESGEVLAWLRCLFDADHAAVPMTEFAALFPQRRWAVADAGERLAQLLVAAGERVIDVGHGAPVGPSDGDDVDTALSVALLALKRPVQAP